MLDRGTFAAAGDHLSKKNGGETQHAGCVHRRLPVFLYRTHLYHKKRGRPPDANRPRSIFRQRGSVGGIFF